MGLTKLLAGTTFTFGLASCVGWNNHGLRSGEVPFLEAGEERKTFTEEDFFGNRRVEVTQICAAQKPVTTLIHLRQMHYTTKEQEKRTSIEQLTPHEKKMLLHLQFYQTNNIQEDIYRFIEGQLQKGLRELWIEGYDRSDYASYNGRYGKLAYEAVLKELQERGFYIEEIQKGTLISCKYLPGAELLLDMEGKITLLPAEDFVLSERANISQQTKTGRKTNVYKNREDYVIQTLAESKKPYGFVLFGGGHNFYDNVEEWNRKYPDAQVSLIELTPASYPEEYTNKPKS